MLSRYNENIIYTYLLYTVSHLFFLDNFKAKYFTRLRVKAKVKVKAEAKTKNLSLFWIQYQNHELLIRYD
jgi:hypothetical protein